MKYNKRFNRFETDNDHHYFNKGSKGFSNEKTHEAKIKCRLVHKAGASIIIPDLLILKSGWIQPLMFMAPTLVKFDGNLIICDQYIDIQDGITIRVRLRNTDYIKTFEDNSQLYKCDIFGPEDLEEYICGDYEEITKEIFLKLFHHTNEVGAKGISNSSTLFSSKWNYRGSKECKNFHFAYFTHLPVIKFESDLVPIAMSKEGMIEYQTDSFRMPHFRGPKFLEENKESIYTAEVYRSAPKDRNYALDFLVPMDAIDIKHIYKHNQGGAVFYEICFPYIHRIRTKPNSKIPFKTTTIFTIEDKDPILFSEYSIIGDAAHVKGLAAPFEEEETKFIFKTQNCGKLTFHDFWFENPNTDHFSDKIIEVMQVTEVKNNPASK